MITCRYFLVNKKQEAAVWYYKRKFSAKIVQNTGKTPKIRKNQTTS